MALRPRPGRTAVPQAVVNPVLTPSLLLALARNHSASPFYLASFSPCLYRTATDPVALSGHLPRRLPQSPRGRAAVLPFYRHGCAQCPSAPRVAAAAGVAGRRRYSLPLCRVAASQCVDDERSTVGAVITGAWLRLQRLLSCACILYACVCVACVCVVYAHV